MTMLKLKETTAFSKFNLIYSGCSITQDVFFSNFEDSYWVIRRYFSFLFSNDSNHDLRKHLLELQSDEHNWMLNLPMDENQGPVEQLYLAQKQQNKTKWIDLNYQHVKLTHHVRKNTSTSDFAFKLISHKKTVKFKNKVNYMALILNLLSVVPVWFGLRGFNLLSFFVYFWDYLLIYLFLHLPFYLFVLITKILLFLCKWLKKFEMPLYKILKPHKKKIRDRRNPRRRSV